MTLFSILGVTTFLNSSKLNYFFVLSYLRSSLETSRALIWRKPDFTDRLMILSRESKKDFCLNSASKFCLTTERLMVFYNASLATSLAIVFPAATAAPIGLSLFYSAVIGAPAFFSSSPPAAAIGFNLSCSALSPLELQSPSLSLSALVLGLFLLTVRASGAYV